MARIRILPRSSTPSCTPLGAAQHYAAHHPLYQGLVVVKSTQPGGKGGWAEKSKETTFYAEHAAAYAAHEQRVRADFDPTGQIIHHYRRNGQCPICGEIFRHCVMEWCQKGSHFGWACGICQVQHGLVVNGIPPKYSHVPAFPFAPHSLDHLARVVVDIREMQAHRAVAPVVTLAQLGA